MLFFFCFLSLLGCFSLSFFLEPTAIGLELLGHVSLATLIVFLISNYKICGKHLNYSAIFCIVLYIFHFGQLLIFTYFIDVYPHVRFIVLMSLKDAVHGFLMMHYAFVAMYYGILFMEKKHFRSSSYSKREYDWIHIAKVIIYLTFCVKFVLDLSTLYISLTAGGTAARLFVNTFPNVFLFWGKISLVGFALLLVCLRSNPSKQLKLFLCIEGYILLMMVSGIRSENVGYLVTFLFIYLSSRKNPLKFKSALLYSVVAFFALTLIVTVGEFRNYSDKSFDSFISLYESTYKEHNVILGLFDNCGDTGYTAHCSINNWLPRFGPTGGDSYYKGLTAVFPNIPGILEFGKITEESSFANKLQDSGVLNPEYYNIGGSLIAELFFNFGLVGGVFFSVVLGVLIGWISRNTLYYMQHNDNYGLIFFIPLMFATIYWVRHYFGGEIREAVWGPLFCYIVIRNSRYKLADKI